MPPVTSVVARWGRALGTACRRVCFLPRDRRGRRRGGAPSPAPSPAPSATRLDGFPRFRVANVIFSAAIVKVSLSLSSPRPLGLLPGGPATPTRDADVGRGRPDRPAGPDSRHSPRLPGASAGRPRPPYTLSCAFQTPFTHAFTLLDSGAITHGPIVSKPWCAVSRLQRTVPVATARTRHTRISSRPAAPAAPSSHFRPARTAARTCTQVRVCSWPWPISHKPALHARMPALGLQASLGKCHPSRRAGGGGGGQSQLVLTPEEPAARVLLDHGGMARLKEHGKLCLAITHLRLRERRALSLLRGGEGSPTPHLLFLFLARDAWSAGRLPFDDGVAREGREVRRGRQGYTGGLAKRSASADERAARKG